MMRPQSVLAASRLIDGAYCVPWRASCRRVINPNSRCDMSKVIRSYSVGLDTIPNIIEASIVGLHAWTATPWWASIALSTIVVRTALFPLVRLQVISSKKVALATPEINHLFQLLKKRLNDTSGISPVERINYLSSFLRGVSASMALHDVSKVEMVAYPLINASVFASFVYSIRTMIANGDDFQFVDGGLLWFRDLEQLDNTMVLPLAALGLSYYALDRAFAVSNGKPFIFFKDFGHSLIILSVPWVAVLPSGVFCYWIPSSLFNLAQTTFLKSEVGMKLLRIPTLPLPPNSQSAQQKL